MPGAPRPDAKAAKLFYSIMKTPKDMRQKDQKRPDQKEVRAWFVDSVISQ